VPRRSQSHLPHAARNYWALGELGQKAAVPATVNHIFPHAAQNYWALGESGQKGMQELQLVYST
jgi:hypothetical protein